MDEAALQLQKGCGFVLWDNIFTNAEIQEASRIVNGLVAKQLEKDRATVYENMRTRVQDPCVCRDT